MTSDRSFDLVLFGATGFTGALVAEHLVARLAARKEPALRLALAGRDLDKLAAARASLATQFPFAAKLPLLRADAHERASLDALAAQARVVCTTVGPYEIHGHELVAACVESGTHYCDLTGEVSFIRAQIDQHHERALETGARIVHACGYDSIPSDVGVLFLQHAMHDLFGGHLHSVRHYFGEARGGVSGGTVASFFHTMEGLQRDPALRRVVTNPYALYPADEPPGLDRSWSLNVERDAEIDMWTGPFIMAPANSAVVRRSNALLGFEWGRDFRYLERASYGAGARGLARAGAMTSAIAALYAGVSVAPLRKLIRGRLPAPGEGPSRARREAGYFVSRLVGTGVDSEGNPRRLRGEVRGNSDPGYGETAKMLGESALCLAEDALTSSGGVLTPAAAMGRALLERLRAAGMVFRLRRER